ncbi:MAG TPA: hypothetical protein VOA41_11065 [Candidatus Dormibacteraeota bacterium]|nr:hypothetical protein [Candidatus Dormibacteraeota bacterium]
MRLRVSHFIRVSGIVLAGILFQIPSTKGGIDKPTANPPMADLDLRGYLVTLNRVSAAVQDLPAHLAGISSLRASLPKSWRVTMVGGKRYCEVSTVWLDSALARMQTDPANLIPVQKNILEHLKLLQEQAKSLDTSQSGVANANANVLPRLNAILQRNEFSSVQPPTWWQKLTARMGGWARRMLTKLLSGKGKHQAVRLVFVWLSIIALFILLAWILGRALVRTAKHAELELGTPMPAGKSWRVWAQEALAAARESRFREAVHFGYWAGVYRLQDLGALKLENARTPREYLRLLEPGSSNVPAQSSDEHATNYRAPLQNLTRQLELTWYGCQPATEHDFAETIENLEALGCRFPSDQSIAGC